MKTSHTFNKPMRAKALLLIALLTLLSASAAKAKSLVVFDGLSVSQYVPMYIYNGSSGMCSRSQFVIPESYLTEMTNGNVTKLRFYTKTDHYGTTVENVVIYLTTTDQTTISEFVDPASATTVFNGSITLSNAWVDIILDTPYVYPGGNLLIGCDNMMNDSGSLVPFLGMSSSGSSVSGVGPIGSTLTPTQRNFIPKTEFTYSMMPNPPSDLTATLTPGHGTIASLSWTENGSATQWDLRYATDSTFAEGTYTSLTFGDTPTASLSDLTPETTYYVRVRSVGDNDQSPWSSTLAFTTPCDPVFAPWYEDFEGFDANIVPDCWDNSNSTSSTLIYYPDNIWGVYSYDGNKMLRMLNYHVASGSALINSPVIVLPNQGVYGLSFDYSHTATCGAFTVKVSEDYGATFYDLASYDNDGTSISHTDPGEFTEVEFVSLADYAGKAIIVQFYADANYGNGAIFVDNVGIDLYSICLRPQNLHVDNTTITDHEATLTWQRHPDGTETAWVLQVATNNTFTEGLSTYNVSDTPSKTLSGLIAETIYYARVKPTCDTEGNLWSNEVSFTTKCETVPAPWYENFEDFNADIVPHCWDNSASNSYTLGDHPEYLWGVYGYGGNKMLRMNNCFVRSGTALVNSPVIFVPSGETYQLTFDYSHTATCGAFKVRISEDNGVTFVEKGSYTKVGSSTSHFDPGTFTEALAISLEEYAGKSIIVQFYAYADYGSGAIFVDNVSIDLPPTCFKPQNLQVDNTTLTAHQATLTWQRHPDGTETAWVLQVATNNTFTEGLSTYNVSGTPSKTLSGLIAVTTYYARVKPDCDTEGTLWSDVVSFTTDFGIPLIEGFAATSVPNGWTRYTGLLSDVMNGTTLTSSSSGWSFGTSNNVFDSHAKVNIYGTNCKYWLVTPNLTMENNVQLSFDMALTKYSGNNQTVDPTQQADDKFVVLITTDGGDTWTILHQWDNAGSAYVYNNITSSSNGQTVSIDLSSYVGQRVAVAFYGESTQSGGDNNLHIDNVSINYIPACNKPTGLDATNITANSAELYWTANSGENAWKLYWKKASEPDDNYTEVVNATNPYVLSGLAPTTEYTFYVVANCGGSDGESEPSNTHTFITACEPYTIAEESYYTCDFETTASFGCWTPIAGVAIQNISTFAHESTCSLKFSGTTDNMVALPQFENATNTLRLEFWTCPEIYSSPDCGTFSVGYMTNLADASTFVEVANYDRSEWTSYNYEMKTVDFVSAPADAYIVLRHNPLSANYYWFVDDVTVKLVPSCLSPISFAVLENSVTAHQATLEWTGYSDSYMVSYRTKAYMDGVEEGFSTSTSTSTPSGWSQYTGLLGDVMGGTATLSNGTQWYFSSFNGVFDNHARINIYGATRKGWLVTPEFTVPSGADFNFDMALTAYSGTDVPAPETTGNDDRFIVLISTDNMGTWTILREWNNRGSNYVFNDIANTATGENVSLDISAYVGQNVRIAFYGESTVNNADNNLHIDNVFIGRSVAAGAWQTVTVEEMTATLTGLTPQTLYEAKVQGDCGSDGLSEETEIITFQTLEAWPGDADEYTIHNTTDWDLFCEALEDNATYNRFVGKTVKLDADISVTRMAGSSGHGFGGTFDGQGHTLTVDYTTTAQYTAPFRYVNGATIMDLTTGGTISTSAKFAGGMVGQTQGGTIEITDCVSGVTINSSVTGDGTHGGFVALASYGTLNFTGCMFSGEMLGASTTLWGGFVGWTESNNNTTATFTDCLFNPTNLTTNNGRTFTRARNMSSVTITNCYYTQPLGTAQGYPAVSDPNIHPYGDPTGTYPVSDLTAYANGLKYGDVFYYNPNSSITQTVALAAGTNWFSTYLDITLADLQAALVAAAPANSTITIKNATQSVVYSRGHWNGTLDWDVAKRYNIKVASAYELTLEGMAVVPSEHPVTVVGGGMATWIGFPLGESMTLTNAFAEFAQNGDVVKSQYGNATYTRGHWNGEFSLEPGKGYLYISAPTAADRTLTFPTGAK